MIAQRPCGAVGFICHGGLCAGKTWRGVAERLNTTSPLAIREHHPLRSNNQHEHQKI
jgi:hypothetical protein